MTQRLIIYAWMGVVVAIGMTWGAWLENIQATNLATILAHIGLTISVICLWHLFISFPTAPSTESPSDDSPGAYR